MNGANGDALEWALALLRAPGERHALRQKPLPDRVDRLLGVAAGVLPKERAEAARAFNESEARICEAARFYAREILFFPQADAYRVLGAEADADDAQLKAHHRLLQHWLHPDRLDNEDDAVFAARVNVAWNRIRNPERRRAYDETLGQDRIAASFEGGSTPHAVRAWATDVQPLPGRWRHRLPLLVLSVCCILLVVLVVRDLERRPEALDAARNRLREPALATEIPMISLPDRPMAVTASVARNETDPSRPAPGEQANAAADAVPVPSLAPERDVLQAHARADETELPRQLPLAHAGSGQGGREAVNAWPATPSMPVGIATLPATASSIEHDVRIRVDQSVPPPPGLPSPERIRKAWQAGEQLLGFVQGSAHSPPPIWSSPGIQSSADRLRLELQQIEGVRLAAPQWTIGSDIAVLRVDFAGSASAHAGGLLTADLSWREERWLVVGLSIEHSQ